MFVFIVLYDDVVVEDGDDNTPVIREMDDNYLGESDNIGTQRAYLNATLGVVSTLYPRDRTVKLLNKPNTNELVENPALAEVDLTHFAPLSPRETAGSSARTTSTGRPPTSGSSPT